MENNYETRYKDLEMVYQSIFDEDVHFVEFKGRFYNDRYCGPWNCGVADASARRPANPHFYRGASLQSDMMTAKDNRMFKSEILAYNAGYEYYNSGFHK